MKTALYNQEGKKVKDIEISDNVFGVRANKDAVHQTMTSLRLRARNGNANVKDRSEVRGGGKKPWKQKGTGRARHGSSRSPIWVGGGITHGPTSEKNYDRKVNANMLKVVFTMVMSDKLKEGRMLFVDSVKLKESKTKLAKDVMIGLAKVEGFETLSRKNPTSTLFLTPTIDKEMVRAFKNLPKIDVMPVAQASILDILDHKNVVLVNPEEADKVLKGRITKKPRKK